MDHLPTDSTISLVRDASRRLVREFGFMGSTFANTSLHASAVHAIIEIGEGRVKTAAALGTVLNLEKSAVSRMLRKLIEAGEVKEQSGVDAREKILSLTDKGIETLGSINAFADKLVKDTTAHLTQDTVDTILHGLGTYATALRAQRLGQHVVLVPDIKIVSGYQPGMVGRCIELHMAYYAPTHGMGTQFEHKLACGLGDLLARLDRPMNQAWVAMDGPTIVGTIFIDGENLGEGKAHLRAFMVGGKARGGGIGRRLLAEAMSFVDQVGFFETHLYTFKGLDSALHLYKAHGFRLAQEWLGTQLGKELTEQRHIRKLGGGD